MTALTHIDITQAAPMRSHTCTECGAPFLAHARLARHAEFCGTECRKAFNNRRAMRGATLYDLFMTLRYERGLAAKLHVWRNDLPAGHGLARRRQGPARRAEVLAERQSGPGRAAVPAQHHDV
jgi:hypothetical protein